MTRRRRAAAIDSKPGSASSGRAWSPSRTGATYNSNSSTRPSEQRAAKSRAGLDLQLIDAAFGKQSEHGRNVDTTIVRGD